MRWLIAIIVAGAALSPAAAWAQSCFTRPDLCNRPIISEINETDLNVAHDLVFLGDGYTAADEDKFKNDAIVYINELKNAPSGRALVTVDPTVFNYHRIFVESATRNLANTDRSDTAFGAIADEFNSITYDNKALQFAASFAPDVDTVVLLVNTPDGRSNAYLPTGHTTGGRLVIRTPSIGVFPHELGHAVFRLLDEYTSNSGCYPNTESSVVNRPNVTTDPTGEKFKRAGNPTPVQGNHLWTQCVYRPRSTCLMRSTGSTPTWCPFCARHIRTQVLERRQGDLDPPYVAFSSPARDAVLTGTVNVSAAAWDSRKVSEIVFKVDGVQKARTTSTTLNYSWNTVLEQDGVKTLTITATDPAGNSETMTRKVTLRNHIDVDPPTISITSPSPGATVGEILWVKFDASDNVGVTRVDLRVNGTTVGSDFAPPWEIAWSTRTVADGAHTLSAVAHDAEGNKATSRSVSIMVVNSYPDTTPPVVKVLRPSAGTLSGVVDIEISATDDRGVSSTEILIDRNKVHDGTAFTWDTTQYANGPHTIQARAEDEAGNVGVSELVHVTLDNDFVPPVLTFHSPRPRAYVRGTVEVEVDASDDRALESVHLQLDGEPLVDGTTYTLDTLTLDDGSHTLTAEALDTAGNRAEVKLEFTVDNTPPVAAVVAPAGGSVHERAPVVEVEVEDASPVTRVELLLDGEQWGVRASPRFRFNLSEKPLSAGEHRLVARVTDAAGNMIDSEEVRFTFAPPAAPDAGTGPSVPVDPGAPIDEGCGCGSGGGGAMLANALLALVLLRRRR